MRARTRTSSAMNPNPRRPVCEDAPERALRPEAPEQHPPCGAPQPRLKVVPDAAGIAHALPEK